MLLFAAETAQPGLFGLFENNLINWILLVVILVYLWMKIMPAVFAERRNKIDAALAEARAAREEGHKFLEEQKQRVTNAEKEADKILVDANKVAAEMKQQMSEDNARAAADLSKKIEQQIATQRQMAITELRSQAAIAAVRLTEATLPGAITDSTKKRLHEQFVAQLDAFGNQGNKA